MPERVEKIGTAKSAERGASEEAIQAHYDVGNDFYALWLDPTMTYSCAIWDNENEDLATAQKRKIDYHIDQARAANAESVLEIGCGWGACLDSLVNRHNVARAIGLTLSAAQAKWISRMGLKKAEVRIENWINHRPDDKYDAIISLAAMPHFVKPELGPSERIDVYRDFFERCYEWLKPGGRLTVETQVYGCGEFTLHSPLSGVFPESDMPKFSELSAGFDGVFDLENIVNHRRHYPPTLKRWLHNLSKNREQASRASSSDTVTKFERFLEAGIKGHSLGVFELLRFTFTKAW